MGIIDRFVTAFGGEDDGSSGLFRKDDATIWVRQPDGTTVEVGSGDTGPWGTAAAAKFSGSGSPVGVVTPDAEGDLYVDATTPALWQATGATSADWSQVSGGGSMPVLVKLNGLYKDYAPPGGSDGSTVLIFDPRAQAWESGATYSVGEVGAGGRTGIPSFVHPSDADSPIFKVCYAENPESGATEPDWPTSEGVEAYDNEIAWASQSYVEWSAELAVTGSDWLVAADSAWVPEGAGTTGGTEPDWASAPNIGDEIVDGSVTWLRGAPVTTWAANTHYRFRGLNGGTASDSVLPTAPAGFLFILDSSTVRYGVSSNPEPDWSTAPLDSGRQVVGGGFVWEETSQAEALALTGIVAPTGEAVAELVNGAALGGSQTVTLYGSDDVDAAFGSDMESAAGNQFQPDGDEWVTLNAQNSKQFAYLDAAWSPLTGA